MTCKPTPIRNNLTRKKRKALKTLKKRTDIVIEPAYKGSGTFIMDHSWYVHKDNLIDNETLKHLSSNSEPKSGHFHILPKIHKQGTSGRPKIFSNGHPTERISESVDYHLMPLYIFFLYVLNMLHTSSFTFGNLNLYRTTPSSSP